MRRTISNVSVAAALATTACTPRGTGTQDPGDVVVEDGAGPAHEPLVEVSLELQLTGQHVLLSKLLMGREVSEPPDPEEAGRLG